MAKFTTRHLCRVPEDKQDFIRKKAELPEDALPFALGVQIVKTSKGERYYYFITYYENGDKNRIRRRNITYDMFTSLAVHCTQVKGRATEETRKEAEEKSVETLKDIILHSDLGEEALADLATTILKVAYEKEYGRLLKEVVTVSDILYKRYMDKKVREIA